MTDEHTTNTVTIAGLLPGTCTHVLNLAGSAAVDVCSSRGGAATILLDTLGRKAMIVALGGVPSDAALGMVRDMETEAAEAQDKGEAKLGAELARTRALLDEAINLMDQEGLVHTAARFREAL